MRVIGIDPGSHHLGWGVIDAAGTRLVHVASGTLHAPAGSLVERLMHLGAQLDALVASWQPQVASVENVFFAKNSQSALKLGQARGAALLCLGRAGLDVFEYSPAEIKQATTGRGRADKQQVQAMMRLLLGLTQALEMDTSDALAAAVCHAQFHNSRAHALWQGRGGS